jgi:hypothetical protein
MERSVNTYVDLGIIRHPLVDSSLPTLLVTRFAIALVLDWVGLAVCDVIHVCLDEANGLLVEFIFIGQYR